MGYMTDTLIVSYYIFITRIILKTMLLLIDVGLVQLTSCD